MKAIRKSDGKVIEVREWFSGPDGLYSDPDMNRFYQASDLDFNVEETEEVTIDGWVARDRLNNALFLHDESLTGLSVAIKPTAKKMNGGLIPALHILLTITLSPPSHGSPNLSKSPSPFNRRRYEYEL